MQRSIFLATGVAVCLALSSLSARALTRSVHSSPFFRKTAVSGFIGSGHPVGEFAAGRLGDGAHESGALDWSVDIEHYFDPRTSLGFSLANTTYDDKDVPQLQTHLSSYGGFLRHVISLEGTVHPYIRLGAGAQQVQFQDNDDRFRSNTAWSVQAGGGLILRLAESFSINGQATYNQGFTENTRVPSAQTDEDPLVIVGFDTKYWSFQGGVSIYFE